MKQLKKIENQHIVDVIFVLALFAIFALCALVLVSIGAGVYQKTVDDMNSNYNSRTSYSYVAEKLRQNDESNSVSVGELSGVNAVILSQEIDGAIYNTYLYAYDGSLRELFASPEFPITQDSLKAGQVLLPVKEFSIEEVSYNLFHFNMVTDDNQTIELYINPKSSRSE